MENLIKPIKGKHKYIVGIDYGHGETSAAIFPIEWEKEAGMRNERSEDIDLDMAARKKVIPSAICRLEDGCVIGEEAFEHVTDNNGIRLGFKQKPQSIDGDAESLMIDYMRAVYQRVLESRPELRNDNHIVYIARPSGWVEEETKELYCQMAIKAGIPLGGLTSESRAAIFYSRSPWVGFAKEITQGAIVFDLGSSTLDFTYLSGNSKPVDYGYNLGASIIDNAILDNMILTIPEVKDFIQKYPAYLDALRFRARKFKELVYGRNPNSKTVSGFPLDNIISDEEESYGDYANTYVKLRINNLDELNQKLNMDTGYIDKMKDAISDFRDNHIPGKKVHGVFLTGGASRMNFIRPIIAECFSLPIDNVKIDGDNPSVTISRGIAMLGAADVITTIMVTELKKQIPSLINKDEIVSGLTSQLADSTAVEAWKAVETSCDDWIRNGKTTDMDELKAKLEKDIKTFASNKVSGIVNKDLQSYISNHSEEIRKKINSIISLYAPGQEISKFGSVEISDVSAINESLKDMSKTITDICDSFSHVIGDILWAAFAVFMFGIFAAPYYIGKAIWLKFRDDSAKRKDKAERILKRKDYVTANVREKMREELTENSKFTNAVSSALSNYLAKQIDNNLKQVSIPIE